VTDSTGTRTRLSDVVELDGVTPEKVVNSLTQAVNLGWQTGGNDGRCNVPANFVAWLLQEYDRLRGDVGTKDREYRHGAHLLESARSMGWADDGEGPFNFIVRRAREVAIEDCRARAIAAEQTIAQALQSERDAIENEARRYAGFYKEASDGRNTFILLAEWIEARTAKAVSPGVGRKGSDDPGEQNTAPALKHEASE
jgi:hypothetical protein